MFDSYCETEPIKQYYYQNMCYIDKLLKDEAFKYITKTMINKIESKFQDITFENAFEERNKELDEYIIQKKNLFLKKYEIAVTDNELKIKKNLKNRIINIKNELNIHTSNIEEKISRNIDNTIEELLDSNFEKYEKEEKEKKEKMNRKEKKTN